MKLPSKKQIFIVVYGGVVIASIALLAYKGMWPIYVDFIVNYLKILGVLNLHILQALSITSIAVYIPIFSISYFMGALVRPYIVDDVYINKRLVGFGKQLDEASKYKNKLQAEILYFTNARDELKEELSVLEQVKVEKVERLKGKFVIKLRSKFYDKLFSRVQSFIYGVLASLVASYTYTLLTST